MPASRPPKCICSAPSATKQNLVVRIKGTGKAKPVLFLCHLDVVEALPKDWHTDPFKFVEKDGYYYGRGTQDMKDSDAAPWSRPSCTCIAKATSPTATWSSPSPPMKKVAPSTAPTGS